MLQNVTPALTVVQENQTPAVTYTEPTEADRTRAFRQQLYIDFVAMAGLRVRDDGSLEMLTAGEFAVEIGVTRKTLYEWQNSIPKFWERVADAQQKIYSSRRVATVWRGIFMRAAKGDHKQAEMYLTHFSNYKLPTQKVEADLRGFTDVLRAAVKDGVIDEAEAEIVEPITDETPSA